MTKKDIIIFPHIPKTGGVSLRVQIEQGIAGNRLLDDIEDFPLIINDDNQQKSNKESFDDENNSIDIVYGHFKADKYKFIEQTREVKLICFLRDPVERTISHYYHWKKIIDQKIPVNQIFDPYLFKLMQSGNLSLVEFSNSDSIKKFYESYLGKQKITDFSFIGITEEFEKSVFMINEKIGTKFIYRKENVNNLKNFDEINSCYDELVSSNEENYHYYNLALKTFWGK